MSRIAKAFEGKKALIPFVVGGDPDIQTTGELIVAMAKAGADMIQIGIPFSDPVAEEGVIQQADERALAGGCTVDALFDMVKQVREKTEIPLIFVTYNNPVYAYGEEKFLAECQKSGIDGIIVADLPYEERDELGKLCSRFKICLIATVATTSGKRMEKIVKGSEGFLCCASLPDIPKERIQGQSQGRQTKSDEQTEKCGQNTGSQEGSGADIAGLIKRIKDVTPLPCAAGAGLSLKPEQVRDMAEIADGVMIDSAIVKLVAQYGKDSAGEAEKLIKDMKVSCNKITEGI